MSTYDNEWQAILPSHVMGRHCVSTRLVYADKYDKDFYTLLYFSNLGQIPKKMEYPPTPLHKGGLDSPRRKKIMPRRNIFSRARMGKNVGTFETKRLGVWGETPKRFWKTIWSFWKRINSFYGVGILPSGRTRDLSLCSGWQQAGKGKKNFRCKGETRVAGVLPPYIFCATKS